MKKKPSAFFSLQGERAKEGELIAGELRHYARPCVGCKAGYGAKPTFECPRNRRVTVRKWPH